MTNHRRVRRVLRAGIEQRFQPSRGPSRKSDLMVEFCAITVDSDYSDRAGSHDRSFLRLSNGCGLSCFPMDAITLTRQLVDIESISGNEAAVGNYLYGELCRIGYQTRQNAGRRAIASTFTPHRRSSHIQRLFSPRTWIRFLRSFLRRKMLHAFTAAARATPRALSRRRLRLRNDCASEGIYVGLLFVVGEERDSLGAKVANEYAASQPAHECKYLVNGEPTENRIALASKGTLRVGGDCFRTHGAFGVSGTRRIGDRQADCGSQRGCARCRCLPIRRLVRAL